MRLVGSRIIVTGGSRGIGRAIAVEAARRGARAVGIIYRSRVDEAEKTLSMIRQLGAEAVAYKVDVRDGQGLGSAVARFAEEYGGIDVAVANAGVLRPAPFLETTPADWEEVIGVNVIGVFNLARTVIPFMVKQGRGVFVVVSSVLGLNPEPEASVYSASKAAVIAWARAVAKELAGDGVRVFAVAPGGVDTEMAWEWGVDPSEWVDEIPLGRLARPEEVAKILLDAVENDYVTGDVITISGGLL